MSEPTQISAIDRAIEGLEKTFNQTEDRRTALIEKLMSTVNQMTVSPGEESPRTTEVKIALINTLDGLLKSSETNAMNRAKAQMQKKDTESSDASRKMVVEMLKTINMKQITPSNTPCVIPSDLDASVNKALEETGHPIDDGELELNEGEN